MDQAALCAFAPDPVRASFLDQRVRSGLAASLAAVFDSLEGHVPFDPAAVAAVLEEVRTGCVAPGLFGLYTDLVVAIFADALDEVPPLLAALLDPAQRAGGGFRAVTLLDEQLGAGQAARYRRMLDDEPEVSFPVGALPAEQLAATTAQVAAALDLLTDAAPELAGEFLGLVRQLVLVESCAPPGDKEALVFDGASTFYLWGALFLNAAAAANRVDLAIALAHEAAHSHLFGIGLGTRLVLNPDTERYASPLRVDARPMDGLVHAAYVLARMVWCLERLLASGRLTPAEAAAAAARLDRHRREFAEGHATVAAHARFTPLGGAVFAGAVEHMRRAA